MKNDVKTYFFFKTIGTNIHSVFHQWLRARFFNTFFKQFFNTLFKQFFNAFFKQFFTPFFNSFFTTFFFSQSLSQHAYYAFTPFFVRPTPSCSPSKRSMSMWSDMFVCIRTTRLQPPRVCFFFLKKGRRFWKSFLFFWVLFLGSRESGAPSLICFVKYSRVHLPPT